MPSPEEIKIIICGGLVSADARTMVSLAPELAAKPRLARRVVRALEQLHEVAAEIGAELSSGDVGAANRDDEV